VRKILLSAVLALSTLAPTVHAATTLPEEKKGDPAPDTKVAQDLLARGRYEDAIRQAKLALGRDERYVPAMIVMAKAYFHLRKFELAGSIVDIAKSIDPSNGPHNAECYNLLGFLALERKDTISATAAFKKATEADPSYGPAWINLSAQYLGAKNYDGAVEAAEQAARLLPRSSRAQMNLGSAYRGKQRYADAEKAYKAATSIDPQLADAYFNLGILYLDAKEMPSPSGPMDLIGKLNVAIGHFNHYKQLASYKLTKDDPVDTYLNDCRTQIDREQKRIERMKKQQERNQPKPAASAPTPAPAK
jgi:tetratricopeptide (TPR) repeat protein